jgi:putative endonuclease
MKQPCVYILASKPNGTLYIGVTSDLHGRMAEHKQALVAGFATKYGVTRLVYYEMHDSMEGAIRREKQLKKWNRLWKLRIIEEINPEWMELFDEATGELKEAPVDGPRRDN